MNLKEDMVFSLIPCCSGLRDILIVRQVRGGGNTSTDPTTTSTQAGSPQAARPLIPGGQSAEEVAGVIADVIERPRADVYTRPGAREMVARYFAAEDMDEAERQLPFARRPDPGSS